MADFPGWRWMAILRLDGVPMAHRSHNGFNSFEESVTLTGLDVQWETPTNVYDYYLESSQDGEEWERFLDASSQGKAGSTQARFDPQVLQHLRLTTSFASAQAANYPVYVAAQVGGSASGS